MANLAETLMEEDKSMSRQEEIIMIEDLAVQKELEESESISIADDCNNDKLSVSEYLISSE